MPEKEPLEVKTTRVEDTGAGAGPESTRGETFKTPDVDIYETDDELVLVADVPGVAQDGAELKLEEGVLEITAHGRQGTDDREPDHEEYRSTGFYRAFRLSEEIDAEKIKAELKDGVLTVRLPKSARAKPRKIEVKPG
jgi:HSP20 family protein